MLPESPLNGIQLYLPCRSGEALKKAECRIWEKRTGKRFDNPEHFLTEQRQIATIELAKLANSERRKKVYDNSKHV